MREIEGGPLADSFGWQGPAALYVGVAAIGLVGVLATRETWGRAERAAAMPEPQGTLDGIPTQPKSAQTTRR